MKIVHSLRLSLLLASVDLVHAASATAEKPNILLIVADDLGYRDLGCYGATKVKTPRIDRLAGESVRFTDAHSICATCMPSRYAILSGTYFFNARRKGGYSTHFHEGQITLPSLLKSAGYRTAALGKWHNGFGHDGDPDWNADLKPGPLEIGFDSFFGTPRTHNEPPLVFVEGHRIVGLDPADPISVDHSPQFGAWGKSVGGAKAQAARTDERIDFILADKAEKFLAQQTRDKPFFLYLALAAPHNPINPAPEFRGKSEAGLYGDYIQQLDHCTGLVIDALEKQGLAQNTIVIFTSDNGGRYERAALKAGHRTNGELLGQKTDGWEGGHRVPFMARWPRHIESGTVRKNFFLQVDLMATLADAAQIALPAGASPDGASELAAFTKPASAPAKRTEGVMLGSGTYVLRQGDWVYIPKAGSAGYSVPQREKPWSVPYAVMGFKNSDVDEQGQLKPGALKEQLYDLSTDLAQSKNIAADYPERAQAMRTQLEALTVKKVAEGKLPAAVAAGAVALAKAAPRQPDGGGTASVSGELQQWHKVTLTLDGPFAHERDTMPNPFTDLAFNVTFTHASGAPKYTVPGYFAADGDAVNTSAEAGTKWRAHLSPDKAGQWNYVVSFTKGKEVALGGKGEALKPFDGVRGSFNVGATDKTGRDFRAKGRLQYVGKHYLQFAGTKEYFLKAGPDAPETLLGYADFDNTIAGLPKKVPLKTWQPHVQDWKTGDPTWKSDKGKGLIGALNYLAGKGVNAFSFLTYNAAGDGDNVWPFIERDDKLHYDCSKLDQWGVVFDHATARGLYLHFKMQENEMDDDRRGHKSEPGRVAESLDGGALGAERKLYCRELIARFGHALALNWNLGEENTQSTGEVRDMARFLTDTDPYRHPVVIHTFPDQQEKVYPPLLGEGSTLAGVSLQNGWNAAHQRTLKWVRESAQSGRPWVVANDEQNPAGLGVPPDIGYRGGDGLAFEKGKQEENPTTGDVKSRAYSMHDIRKLTLWGTLMAGGAGVEYYFGYQLAENDLVCEDWRSRDKSWDYCRIALDFFRAEKIPFWEMQNADALLGNAANDNSKFCLAKAGESYLVYLPNGGTTDLDLTGARGDFAVRWFNPREGGALAEGSVAKVGGGGKVMLGNPPAEPGEDWVVLIDR